MRRQLTVLALGAIFMPAAIIAGCGGVPGNAVAEVDGTAIEKDTYEHWLNVAAKSAGPDAKVPVPPDYAECIAQAKGTLDKQLDNAVFSAKKNQLEGPIKTQYGYYVFSVTGVTAASQQTLAEAKPTIKQTLQSQNQQKALDAFVKDFTKRWKSKTECSADYKTTDCKNGPKATPTPTAPATDPSQQAPQQAPPTQATPAPTTEKK